jgi:hypothetical protein
LLNSIDACAVFRPFNTPPCDVAPKGEFTRKLNIQNYDRIPWIEETTEEARSWQGNNFKLEVKQTGGEVLEYI